MVLIFIFILSVTLLDVSARFPQKETKRVLNPNPNLNPNLARFSAVTPEPQQGEGGEGTQSHMQAPPTVNIPSSQHGDQSVTLSTNNAPAADKDGDAEPLIFSEGTSIILQKSKKNQF
jgi:hypothetical protein